MGLGKIIRVPSGWLSGLLFFSCICCAQVMAQSASPGELLRDSEAAVQSGDYEEAAVLMYDYLSAVEQSDAERVVRIAQDVRFRLSTVLIELERLDEAAVLLETYIKQPFVAKPRQARKLMVTCFFETPDYESAAQAASNAIAFNANPRVEAVRKKMGYDRELETDEETEVTEEPYTSEEVTSLYQLQGEALFNLKRWAEAVPAYEYVIEHAQQSQQKGYAIMQLVNSLIEIPDFDRVQSYIPQLYATDARYDIRVNLALLNVAGALVDAEKYSSALPLYRMIVPKDELLAFQEKILKELRVESGLPPEIGGEVTQAELLVFGAIDESEVETEELDEDGELQKKSKALREHEALMKALEAMPPYEVDVEFRMAEVYRLVDRPYEGLALYERVMEANPTNQIAQGSIYERTDLLLKKLGRRDEAIEGALAYIEAYPEGLMPRQLAYLLSTHLQPRQQYKQVKRIAPYLDKMAPTDDEGILVYDRELYFMQAVADLMLFNFEDSERGFGYMLDTFPGSDQYPSSLYWYAMSKLFLEKHAEAKEQFERYLTMYPEAGYSDECVYQIGVCLFGQDLYDEAMEQFTLLINTHPDSAVFPDACSMRGDILGSRGELDDAVADYERAIDAAGTAAKATYPTFQMVEIFQAEARYERIINAIELYLASWGDQANISKAVYWLGRTKIKQDKLDEAIDAYMEALIAYGDNVLEDGVDLIVDELSKIARNYLNQAKLSELRERIQIEIEKSTELTLELRLRVLLASLDKNVEALGEQLLVELRDLDQASPPVLAAICRAAAARGEYSRAEELLTIFVEQFDESEFIDEALKLYALAQMDAGEYEEAIATIQETQERYGTIRKVVWAQLLRAEALLKLKRYDEAHEANSGVLGVPAWRGEPVAQATYQLGQVEEARGKWLKAHAFYQRTYFQYKGYAKGYWAAEAYLASARCLERLGLENDRRNTFRAMLFDPYVNELDQAVKAREVLGIDEVAEIEAYIETGGTTNINVQVEAEVDA